MEKIVTILIIVCALLLCSSNTKYRITIVFSAISYVLYIRQRDMVPRILCDQRSTIKYKENKILKHASIYNRVLPNDLCQRLIRDSIRFKYGGRPESVDSWDTYQIDLYDVRYIIVTTHALWKTVKPVYTKFVVPLVQNLSWLQGKECTLMWAFVRRYQKNERTHLNVHKDSCDVAVTLLLSDESQYKGGEFYLFKPSTERAEVINNIKNMPIINQKRGDVIIYKGSSHWHGILPVSSGSRYAIIFFFNTNPPMDSDRILETRRDGCINNGINLKYLKKRELCKHWITSITTMKT